MLQFHDEQADDHGDKADEAPAVHGDAEEEDGDEVEDSDIDEVPEHGKDHEFLFIVDAADGQVPDESVENTDDDGGDEKQGAFFIEIIAVSKDGVGEVDTGGEQKNQPFHDPSLVRFGVLTYIARYLRIGQCYLAN